MSSVSSELMEMVERAPAQVMDLSERLAVELVKRVKIPINSSTTPDEITALNTDPWKQSGKYGLGWVYFGIIIVLTTTLFRLYNYWGDKIRTALYKEEVINSATEPSPYFDHYELPTSMTDGSTRHFFPPQGPLVTEKAKRQATVSAIAPLNNAVAFVRFIFYRPVPPLQIKGWKFSFPSLGVMAIVSAGLIFSILYCFLPQPLFYQTMAYGSPPLAIRAGMLSVALLPWIVALASKVNVIAFMTGIGAERLIVLHRWGAYLCAILAVVHAVPFWYQSTKDPRGFAIFQQYFTQQYYIFTTGIAAIIPLVILVVHSLPILRHKAYELFVLVHIPVSWAFIALMFWHCHNYLTSWAYLYATVVLLVFSLVARLFYVNWMNPLRPSWLIGEESAVTILPENAVKVTIPTQKKWKPGQYAYLRMPGIALLDSHPFTIASLCSEDFPSEYGEQYRDMTMVFRPFGGFTRKLLNTATKKGPFKTYRAFVEGPYGGMTRQISSFDQVIFFAGGSGITAIASQMLDLIKRMRDGKATTRVVHVIWAMKRPEIMEWFKEELRICREFAPADSVHCNFYITSAKRFATFPTGDLSNHNRLSGRFAAKIDNTMQEVASKRNSRIINPEELDLKREAEDEITALPQAYHAPPRFASKAQPYFPPPPGTVNMDDNGTDKDKRNSTLSEAYSVSDASMHSKLQPPQPTQLRDGRQQTFDFGFGFPTTPTEFQKSLMRFAFLPTTTTQPQMAMPYASPTFPTETNPYRPRDGWRTEYGRPDIPYTLKALSKDFGRRTCVFVCGPPEMRMDVSKTVADLQRTIWSDSTKDELYLHTENYSI